MANEFLWKELTENDKEEIKEQAKEIMDNFAKKLESIKDVKEAKSEFESDSRKEKTPCEKEINREIMFQNAPNKNEDFIIAEKKKW